MNGINLIGVPLDFGAGRRGVDMGPSAIRYAGLRSGLDALGIPVTDHGNVAVPVFENCQISDPKLRYIDCIVPIVSRVMEFVRDRVDGGQFPLVIGGDHSLSLGSVRGAAKNKRLGVIWIDAHADFNTHETTPSGNIHGMPLAALVGKGDQRLVKLDDGVSQAIVPEHVVVVGARDIDLDERISLQKTGINIFAMDFIDRHGIKTAIEKAIEIAAQGTDGIYLSFDMDALDPLCAPGVGTAVQGGLTYREAHLACEILAESELLLGMDLVEVNPILDDQNKTAELAVELILSALGKRIY